MLELLRGDITRQSTDAIVNAANSELAPGGGVAGAIHSAAGETFTEECRQLRAKSGRLATGKAIATGAGKLRVRHVIHTVGPVWHGGDKGEPAALAGCYRESIRVADELGLTSISFPSISTGIFGYPVEEAAPVALAAVREAMRAARYVKLVRFVLFDEATLDAYRRAADTITAVNETA